MRVFVTGASGHIGSAVVPELLGAGHQVVGLARSDTSAAKLSAAGAEALRGDLDDLDGIGQAAAAADGVIHLAFKHEAMRSGDFVGAAATDLRVVETIGAALEGSGRPFVSTSGTLMLTMAGVAGRLGTEQDVAEGGPRVDSENTTIALADRGVRSSVVRLPPLVHSSLDHHGFGPTLIAIAREQGRLRLRRRWVQPVACGAHARCRARLSTGTRGGPGGIAAARRGGSGRAVPRHRRGDWPPARRPDRERLARGGGRVTSVSSAAWCRSTTRRRATTPSSCSAGSRSTPD